MFLCLLNCIKVKRKTQIYPFPVTKCTKNTKFRPKTACFPDHVIKRLAIFTVLGTQLTKNLISIQTIFELKYYPGNIGTTSFPTNKS